MDNTISEYFNNLREYQKEATANIDYIFDRSYNNRLAAVIFPTGGGKSFVAIQQMLSRNNKDYPNLDRTKVLNNTNMLYLAPNHEILSQIKLHIVKNVLFAIPNLENMSIQEIDETIRNDFKTLNFKGINYNVDSDKALLDDASASEKKKAILRQISSEDISELVKRAFPNLKFKCYAGVKETNRTELDKEEEVTEEDIESAEFVMLDEAHRIGAEKWGKNIQKLLDKNKTAKILPLTATSDRRDYKEMMSEIAKMVYGEKIPRDDYMAKEIHVLDAMRDGIVTSPDVVPFDSALAFSDQYKDVEKRYKKASGTEKQKLEKILDDMDEIIGFSPRTMTKKELEEKRQEHISKVFSENIKNPNGKYIAFIPRNIAKDGTEKPATKQYFEKQAEQIRKQFKNVKDKNGNPVKVTITYVTSDTEVQSQEENSKVLKDFEDASSTNDGIKIVLSINKLNEGVHVEGIDGAIMYRNIGEDSSILYLQQSGRCISSMDPNKPLSKQEKTQIFDIAGNTFAQVNNKTGKKVSRSYDLSKIKEIRDWIEANNGRIPDINSNAGEAASDKEKAKAEVEARLAIALKRLKTKYNSYKDGNIPKQDKEAIKQIVEIANEINLWGIQIPDRILKPTEEELTGAGFLEFTPSQKKFMELYDEAVSISKGKSDDSKDRIAKLINILKILKMHKPDLELPSGMMIKEGNKEIRSSNFKSVSLDKILKENFSEKEISTILLQLQDFDLLDAQNRREIYHPGEQYDLGKELAFVRGKLWTSENDFMENDGKSPFERYTFKQLLDLGIVLDKQIMNTFNDLYQLFGVSIDFADNDTGFMKNADKIVYNGHKLAKTPFGLIQEFEDSSLISGEKYINGIDKNGFDQEGYDEFGYNELGFNRQGTHRKTGTEYNERGFYFDEKKKEWINVITSTNRDLLGYDVYGIDERGFERPVGPVKDKDGKYNYSVPLWHKKREDGTYDRNGSYTIRANCDEKSYDVHGFKSNGKSKFRIFEGIKANYRNPQGFWSNGAKTDKPGPFDKSDVYSKNGLDIDGYDEYGFKKVETPDGKTLYVNRDTSAEYDRKGRVYTPSSSNGINNFRQLACISNTKLFMRQFLRHRRSFKDICQGYSERLDIPIQEAEIGVKNMLNKAFSIYRSAPEAFDESDDFEGLEYYFNDKGYYGKRNKVNEFFEICPTAKENLIRENNEIIRALKILESKKRLTLSELNTQVELEQKKKMYDSMRLDER